MYILYISLCLNLKSVYIKKKLSWENKKQLKYVIIKIVMKLVNIKLQNQDLILKILFFLS